MSLYSTTGILGHNKDKGDDEEAVKKRRKRFSKLGAGKSFQGAPAGVRQGDLQKILRDPVRAAKLAVMMEDSEKASQGTSLDQVFPGKGLMMTSYQLKELKHQRRLDNVRAWREKIRPVLDFYRDQIERDPDLEERNTMAAVVLSTLDHLDDWRAIQKALKQLQEIFEHSGTNLTVRRGRDKGSIDDRIKQLMSSMNEGFRKSEILEGEVVDVTGPTGPAKQPRKQKPEDDRQAETGEHGAPAPGQDP